MDDFVWSKYDWAYVSPAHMYQMWDTISTEYVFKIFSSRGPNKKEKQQIYFWLESNDRNETSLCCYSIFLIIFIFKFSSLFSSKH